MNFKELLKKYKNGEVTEQERITVETELEKYEAIEEYFSDNDLLPLTQSWVRDQKGDCSETKEKISKEILNINRAINNRLRRVVFSSVMIVVLLYVSIFYVLSPAIDMIYYNPSLSTVGENPYTYDVLFDLKAITELNIPDYAMWSVRYIDSQGFGRHSISYYELDLFTQEEKKHSIEIKRGLNITPYLLYRTNINFHDAYILHEKDFFEERMERVGQYLDTLNPISYVSAYVTFEEDISLEEFARMKYDNYQLDFKWVGVRTRDRAQSYDNVPKHITGFNPAGDGPNSDRPNPEKYPSFRLADHIREGRTYTPEEWAKTYEEHYRSLLNYLIDRNDAVQVLDDFFPGEYKLGKIEYYSEALEYIDNNGVNAFGVLVYGEARDLLKFIEKYELLTVDIGRVLASKPKPLWN